MSELPPPHPRETKRNVDEKRSTALFRPDSEPCSFHAAMYRLAYVYFVPILGACMMSVCLSVCPSVTLVDCDHIEQ